MTGSGRADRAASRTGRTCSSPDTSGLLAAFIVLALAVPAPLRVGPLGAAGHPASLVGLGLLLLWLCAGALGPGAVPGRWRQPLHLALATFAGAMVVGYASGTLRPLVGLEQRSSDRALLAIAGLCGVTLMALDGLRDRRALDRVVRVLVLVTTVLAVIGLVQFVTGADPVRHLRPPGLEYAASTETFTQERWGFRRVAATSTHPIELGVLLAAVLPLAIHRALTAPTGRPVARWVPTALLAVVVPMTGSRSAIAALGAAGIVLGAWATPAQRRRAVVALVVYAAAMKVVVPGLLGTIRSIFLSSPTDPSVQGRVDDYATIGDYLDGHLLIGRGLGTFVPERYLILDNQYLGSLLETGVLGLVALLGLLFVAWMSATCVRRLAPGGTGAALGGALAGSIAALAVAFATFDALGYPMSSACTFLVIGLAGANLRVTLAEAEPGEQAVALRAGAVR